MRIPKDVFKKLTAVAAQESTRYAINGVRFRRIENDAIADATDGRMMLRARWTDKGAGEFDAILSASALKKTKLAARITEVELTETDVNGSATIVAYAKTGAKFGDDGTADQDVDTIDGRFPNTDQWLAERVNYDVDDKTACHVFAVDPRLLATLLDTIAKVATDEQSRGVRIVCPLDATQPIRIDASSDDVVATGVLMPVSMKHRSYTAPRTGKAGVAC